jgi:hypothetical protein
MAVFAVVFVLSGTVLAADNFGARLRGWEEVPPVSTTAQGFFFAQLNGPETQLDYSLVYFNLTGNVTQAHIHIGQPGVNGGIVLFLCTNLTPPAGVPAPPACPAGNTSTPVSVSGTLTAANVITQAGQGIGPNEFSEVMDALRAIVTYANIHSDLFPGGELRGTVTH